MSTKDALRGVEEVSGAVLSALAALHLVLQVIPADQVREYLDPESVAGARRRALVAARLKFPDWPGT